MIPYGTTVEEAQERLHEPSISRKNGLLFLNPGSAGPRRFNLPINLALLRVMGGKVEAQLVELRV
jgi:predicted phosphodiesterase